MPQASGNLAAASATSDFWNSPYFHPSALIAAQAKSTVERIKQHQIVLAVQDTTSLDFTTQKAKKGMGYLDCKTSFGLKVHTTLGVSPQGIPLGLINQYFPRFFLDPLEVTSLFGFGFSKANNNPVLYYQLKNKQDLTTYFKINDTAQRVHSFYQHQDILPNMWVGTAQQELEKTRIENIRLYYYKLFSME